MTNARYTQRVDRVVANATGQSRITQRVDRVVANSTGQSRVTQRVDRVVCTFVPDTPPSAGTGNFLLFM